MADFDPESPDQQDRPARPRRERPRSSLGFSRISRELSDPRAADASNPSYVQWLKRQSMLGDADILARGVTGSSRMWRNAYAVPDARRALNQASTWFTTYPSAMITRDGQSFLEALADEELWEAFSTIGVHAIHTGPTKTAGGLEGWQATPSVDGHFDRISTRIDPAFGTDEDFQRLTDVADQAGGIVIDDIVPGHTGKGADFRLAEMAYKEYPGIFHMVEIPQEHWHLLPEVTPGMDTANLSVTAEKALADLGFIIGSLQRVIFYAPGIKETNWSATREVLGVDGVVRRWVYLHYFKEGQPTINWLDPTFAGMRLVIGDALHSLGDLGASALRLDANGFLGVEKRVDAEHAWSEGHPLSVGANQFIASMIRKVGGFSFQELNLTINDIHDTGEYGADLSYDFITRPGYQHALLTGNTEFLRLTLRASLAADVQPVRLIHALQNHDELTYELVHWETRADDERFEFRGEEITGPQLAMAVRRDLTEKLTGNGIDYNRVFTTNGIACTSSTVAAAALGYGTLDDIDEAGAAQIRRAHLLLAAYNSWQPGAFALSAWDLVGALTVPSEEVAELIDGTDTRWIERGAIDLMGVAPEATESQAGLPKARILHGTVPEQLDDPESFLNQLTEMLRLRTEHKLHLGTQLDVPEVSHPGLLVMVHRLDEGEDDEDAPLQVTVLNFATEAVTAAVRSEELPVRHAVIDAATGEEITRVDDLQGFSVELDGLGMAFLLIGPSVEDEDQ